MHQFLIPRLNGQDIRREMPRLLALVQEGIAGFIIFGGELQQVRQGIAELQAASKLPLIISSDLEQGLGQQLSGGTIFPPAMAMARAGGELMDAAFAQVADEAAYAGINTVFAPVLDMNTNPRNPIICTRAFGEDADTVTDAAQRMIRAFEARGITACGKHFPGHGDTEVDSHIKLPVINKTMAELEVGELVPFKRSLNVPMLMMAHLSVPAMDSVPISLSRAAVEYLRQTMGYRGLLITDAMNMGGLGGYTQIEATLMALRAGVDIILHPDEPERLAGELAAYEGEFDASRLVEFRRGLDTKPQARPRFDLAIAQAITTLAIKVEGSLGRMANPHIVVLDDTGDKGAEFIAAMLEIWPAAIEHVYTGEGELTLPPDSDVIAAIFSPVRAWKGGASGWIERELAALGDRARAVVSFGSPYILDAAPSHTARICAYWDHISAQKAAAGVIRKMGG